MNARTHSTCFVSLGGAFVSEQGRVVPLDALLFEFFDQPIAIELRLLLDILYERPRFSLLKKA